MKEFNLICAVSLNGIIGDSASNSIPWYLPADLKHFKQITTGHPIVMGAKTYNSLGKNLPNRKNVVVTRGNTDLCGRPDDVYMSFADAFRNEEAGFFVIGGEHIFRESFKYLPRRLYLTRVLIEVDGDVLFPIDARRLAYDNIVAPNGGDYWLESRSEVKTEFNMNFQFTVFKRN